MKSRTGLFVLLAEIVAIVILHSAKLSRQDSDKPGTQSQTEANYQVSDQKGVVYTSLK